MSNLHHEPPHGQRRPLTTRSGSQLGAGSLEPPLSSGERRRVQLAFLEILQRKLEIRLAQVRTERQVLLSGAQQ